jgi:hypothetical protein
MLTQLYLCRLFLAAADESHRDFIACFSGADEDGELPRFNEKLVLESRQDVVRLKYTGGRAVGNDGSDHEPGILRQIELFAEGRFHRDSFDAEKCDGFPGHGLGVLDENLLGPRKTVGLELFLGLAAGRARMMERIGAVMRFMGDDPFWLVALTLTVGD